ncbi:DEAD/DEAH box helicase [Rubritalea tangerina]|uniref:DEAD/DEAH box helicase n=1 Tax=Rubritalea tangerina TaxID=430798 RepID=A0ABW4ZG61_9BACT
MLDESQYIKNTAAKTTKTANEIKANHRLCLSGTPMENHLGELWSTFNFLMPGLLQNQKNFNTTFRHPIEKHGDTSRQTSLNRRVGPLMLRRTKDVVAKELPPKTIIPHFVQLTDAQTNLYESVRATMDKRVRDAIRQQGLNKSHILILDALLKLRQICCHPKLLKIKAAQEVIDSAKLDYLTNLLNTLIEEERKILLFSQFTTMLDLIESHLKKQNIPFVKITGSTKDRSTPVEQFQSGTIPVFLISLKAGGTGLNLTAADTVIHYDPWWNPAAENQATDRAYRIGQKKPVFVHKLICQGTIEEHIQKLQEKKAKLVESLLSQSTNKLKIDQATLGGLLSPINE